MRGSGVLKALSNLAQGQKDKISYSCQHHLLLAVSHSPPQWSSNAPSLTAALSVPDVQPCLLYTSDAADDTPCVDL
eukprot:3161776-Amphidinium_carterae.1